MHNQLIGRRRKYYYFENTNNPIKWYLEEITAYGENSNLAVYKLYPGKEAERQLWVQADALVINPGAADDPLPAYLQGPQANLAPPAQEDNPVHQNAVPPQNNNANPEVNAYEEDGAVDIGNLFAGGIGNPGGIGNLPMPTAFTPGFPIFLMPPGFLMPPTNSW